MIDIVVGRPGPYPQCLVGHTVYSSGGDVIARSRTIERALELARGIARNIRDDCPVFIRDGARICAVVQPGWGWTWDVLSPG